jgi:hypothetical protein
MFEAQPPELLESPGRAWSIGRRTKRVRYDATASGRIEVFLFVVRLAVGSKLIRIRSSSGHYDICKFLIDAGARTDIQDADGRTPFEIAKMIAKPVEVSNMFSNDSNEE